MDLFLSGWNSGFRHKGLVPFCPTARRFSRNFFSSTTCITFFLSTFVLYIVLFHLLNYALFPAQSFVSFGVLSTYRNQDRAFPILLHAMAWLLCVCHEKEQNFRLILVQNMTKPPCEYSCVAACEFSLYWWISGWQSLNSNAPKQRR